MPTPQQGESEEDFVSRCIPIVLEDGAAEDREQAVAVCFSMWREAQEEGDKMTDKQMEHKTFSGFVTKADEEQGIVEAFFAVFGNIDGGNDIVHPGAFAKTFSERGGKVKVLDNHRTDSIMRAIGKPLFFDEVGRDELPSELLLEHPDAKGGAFARVQMLMDTPEGQGAFVRLRDKAVTEWSFGYDALDFDFSTEGDANVRNLRQVKLYEISPVLWGMNPATTTVSAKSEDGEDDKAINLSQQIEDIRQSFHAQYNPANGPWAYWVNTVYDEYVIVTYDSDEGVQYFQVSYSEGDDGKIEFAPRAEWTEGQYEFMPGKFILRREIAELKELVTNLLEQVGPDDAPPQEDSGEGPDDAPPTETDEDREKTLRALHIMAAEMQLSEAT